MEPLECFGDARISRNLGLSLFTASLVTLLNIPLSVKCIDSRILAPLRHCSHTGRTHKRVSSCGSLLLSCPWMMCLLLHLCFHRSLLLFHLHLVQKHMSKTKVAIKEGSVFTVLVKEEAFCSASTSTLLFRIFSS